VNYADIHWAALPDANGHEQRGRRPAIIWQDMARYFTPTVLVIPFTARPDALRFPGSYLVRPSSKNDLAAPSIAMVFQLRACDTNRVGARLGRLDDPDLAAIRQLAKALQMLP
jgi:mRNA-degrading endonuclease toxin of MazEF toxin-antitoxin module